jgi:hypothetical protein
MGGRPWRAVCANDPLNWPHPGLWAGLLGTPGDAMGNADVRGFGHSNGGRDAGLSELSVPSHLVVGGLQ